MHKSIDTTYLRLKEALHFRVEHHLLEYSYRDSIYVVCYLEMEQSGEIIFLSVITFKILVRVLEVHIHKFYLYYRLSIYKGASISEILYTLVLSTLSARASLIIYEMPEMTDSIRAYIVYPLLSCFKGKGILDFSNIVSCDK